MTDPLTTELENAVAKGLGSAARMTGGARNGISATMAQGPSTMADVIEALEHRNTVLKSRISNMIDELQHIRETL